MTNDLISISPLINTLETLKTRSEKVKIPFCQNVIVDYRGYHIEFFPDNEANQMCAMWENKKVGFGVNYVNYVEDVERMIDSKLDLIYVIKNLSPNLRLKYFNNGGNRDIKLEYRGRILKIYLSEDYKVDTQDDLNKLIQDAGNFFLARYDYLLADEEK